MSKKTELRIQRTNTVINRISKNQEKRLEKTLTDLQNELQDKYGVTLVHHRRWFLNDIVSDLKSVFQNVDFTCRFSTSYMQPDGGIVFIVDTKDSYYPILITEIKNQGTNDLRALEGKKKQSRGNAIERLGKNVIGFRTALMKESIFPFVCFGDGCDFAEDSSIVDRVITVSMFGDINTIRLHNEGCSGQFNRGSFFFRVQSWTEEDMRPIMKDIAERSIQYYFSKYGEDSFKH